MKNKRSNSNVPDFVAELTNGMSLADDGGNGSASINDPKPPSSGGSTSEGDN
ncbi:MAG: hypothetical protein WBB45_06170 [Cyclobacteriaceae bacterium]